MFRLLCPGIVRCNIKPQLADCLLACAIGLCEICLLFVECHDLQLFVLRTKWEQRWICWRWVFDLLGDSCVCSH